MTKILLAGLSIVLASVFTTGTAFAAGTNVHSWVSSSGSGTTCSRSAPCASITTAVENTKSGGTVSILDASDNSPNVVTIDKAITIRAEGVEGGATTTGILVGSWFQVQAPPDAVVTLEGLYVSGFGSVDFLSGAQLNIVRCVFSNGTAPGNAGIRFEPNSAGKLNVIDTVINNMGSNTGGGIVVNPQAGGTAQVALERVSVFGNAFGIAADGTASTGGINMTIADSMVANNTNDGILATTSSGHAPIGVMIENSRSVNNNFGARSIGPGVTIRASNSTFIGNTTGLSFSGDGSLLSFGNNKVRANGADGAFSGPVGLQ